ncbi:MAG: radical SAM protein [Candidatus Thorarchaeota archaeon]
MDLAYPLHHHPCWSNSRINLWQRIHLPVASSCNVKCAFCQGGQASSCHTSAPGSAQVLMSPEEALRRTLEEMDIRPSLHIVAISGPGEPLANEESFVVFDEIRKIKPETHFCLSTNGLLLSQYAERIQQLGVETVSVSISAIRPSTASLIYEWAMIDGKVLTGDHMGREIIKRQFKGVSDASRLGIRIKVNTILTPGVNNSEITDLAKHLAMRGAAIQNIVPLVPNGNMKHLRPPSKIELQRARVKASQHIPQFHHCHQCRSDVVGIPGTDTLL